MLWRLLASGNAPGQASLPKQIELLFHVVVCQRHSPEWAFFAFNCQKEPRQDVENSRTVLCKMFLLFSQTLLIRSLSIVKIGKKRQLLDSPLGRFGSSRPSLRRRIVLE
jgi:hypothetical protein